MRDTLLSMLTYKRPMGSPAERQFRARYLLTLPNAFEDRHKNIHVPVGTSRVLWSSHTDTVHGESGRQRIALNDGIVSLADVPKTPVRAVLANAMIPSGRHKARKARAFALTSPAPLRTCLGADDTVGVYLMREMVLARIAGYYIFHYGEERGGIGSSSLAQTNGDWLRASFDVAIALDRQDTGDIVTHQFGERTASDAFADSLGEALHACDSGLVYVGTPGVYTDTAEYARLIPECTNLSVGYRGQHGATESVNVRHVDKLLGALLTLDTSRLSVERDPTVREDEASLYTLTGVTTDYTRDTPLWDDDDHEDTELDRELRLSDPTWWDRYAKLEKRYK